MMPTSGHGASACRWATVSADSVPAPRHQGVQPDDEALKQCNLGYAHCSWLPAERIADAVRFCVSGEARSTLRILYAVELNHAPGESGALEFSRATVRLAEPSSR